MSSAAVGSSRSTMRRLLRERAGDDDPLALAAAQRAERSVAERQQVEPRERPRRRFAVGLPLARQRRRGRAFARASTYSATVSHGGVTGSCGTTATRRASSRRPERTGVPIVRARPSRRSGRARRPRAAASSCRRRSGRSARPTPPRSTSRSTSSTTGRPPSATVTPSSAMALIRRRRASGARARRTARR